MSFLAGNPPQNVTIQRGENPKNRSIFASWRASNGPSTFVNDCSPIYRINLSNTLETTVYTAAGFSFHLIFLKNLTDIQSLNCSQKPISINWFIKNLEKLRTQLDSVQSASSHRISSECRCIRLWFCFRTSNRRVESSTNSYNLFWL